MTDTSTYEPNRGDNPDNTGQFSPNIPSAPSISNFTRPPSTDVSIGEDGTIVFRTADGRRVDWFPDADDNQITSDIEPRATILNNGNVRLAWASTADTRLIYEHGAELHMMFTGEDRNTFIQDELGMGTDPKNIFLVGLGEGSQSTTHVRLSTLIAEGLTSTPAGRCSAVVFATDQNGRVVSDEDALQVLGEVRQNINGEIYDVHTLEFTAEGEPLNDENDTTQNFCDVQGGTKAQAAVDEEVRR